MRIGHVFFRDEDGQLWLAETFCSAAGLTATFVTLLE